MAMSTVTIGNVRITSLSDGVLDHDLCSFYPSIPAEDWGPYEDFLIAEHKIRFNLGSFFVRSDGINILVDTGLGPDPAFARESARGELLDDLMWKGVGLDEIDIVFMTHLHRDHVGWNLLPEGSGYRPTFPKARYWISAKDWEFFSRPENLEQYPTTKDCVLPLESLGLVELFEGERSVTREVTTWPTPGHTPGHMSILISSQGQRGLILGDVAHSPVQVHETEWCSRVDVDPEQTRVTRRSLMERLEGDGTLVASGHFPAPGFGKVVRAGGRRHWQPL